MNSVHFKFYFIPKFLKNSNLIKAKIGSKTRGGSYFCYNQVDKFAHFYKFIFHFYFILSSIDIRRTSLEIIILSFWLISVFYI